MRSKLASGLVRWRVPLGWALGLLTLVLAKPTPSTYAGGLAIAAVGESVRLWASGHLVKGEGITRSGPYAWTRNPLYLGSTIMGLGFGLASRSWVIFMLFVGFVVGVILPVIRTEATKLAERHPRDFRGYAEAVPLFFPALRPHREWLHEREFDWGRVWANREYRAVAGWLGAVWILGVKMLVAG